MIRITISDDTVSLVGYCECRPNARFEVEHSLSLGLIGITCAGCGKSISDSLKETLFGGQR